MTGVRAFERHSHGVLCFRDRNYDTSVFIAVARRRSGCICAAEGGNARQLGFHVRHRRAACAKWELP
jgi:hypothetical protein